MTKRALVTGGAGFIGSHMCDLLVSRGYAVDIIDDLSSGLRENVPGPARLHVFDVRSPEAARLVRETAFDVIVHFAAQMDVRKSVADPLFDASVNVMGTVSLLEALRASPHAATTRFVFISTGGAVYGDLGTPPNAETTTKDPESPYAISKLSAEYYLSYFARVHGMDTACVRYANVYGPRQNIHGEAGVVCIFCGRLLGGRPLTVFGDGEQTRDYVYVGDVVEATYAVATATLPPPSRLDTRAFNVGTGVETSVLQLANTLARVAGGTPSLEFLPKRPGEQLRSVLDIDKIRTQLDWSPRVSLADGLARTFEWFQARHRSPDPVGS
jgi:UDP-glucose 4-epimerase